MRRSSLERDARLGQGLEGRCARRAPRRDRHALRPCLEGCESRLLLSTGRGSSGYPIHPGTGSGSLPVSQLVYLPRHPGSGNFAGWSYPIHPGTGSGSLPTAQLTYLPHRPGWGTFAGWNSR
jgi:hypothetical protein